MSDNWDADARVGVPMMQVIAKQVSQHKHSPREVRRIIDAQWLDEESKQQLRETFRVTDADLAVKESEAVAGAANGREAAGEPQAANGSGTAKKRGKANKREPGQRESAGQREPATQREAAGPAEAAD
jgi:hypothetical protein